MDDRLKVLVLMGGPDRERGVSLKSGAAIAAALRQAGHTVTEGDINPDDDSALRSTDAQVVFPALHGRFGEGGALQRMLDARRLPYVGSRASPSAVAIDKVATKRIAEKHRVPTPPYQFLGATTELTLPFPLVVKPLTEGSTYGVEVCRDAGAAAAARTRQHAHYAFLMAETFIAGREVTVGILGDEPLPVVEIRPEGGFYDFHAKYESDRTRYLLDEETGLPGQVLERLKGAALKVHREIGCRHLSRSDFMVDSDNGVWFLEINTLPGFTDHSLFPMAARRIGLEMPALCDRLVRMALRDGLGR